MDDTTILRGIVHGRTIEVESDTGLPDGEPVTVTVHRVSAVREKLPSKEGLRRAFGGWAGDDEEGLDEYLEWNRQRRK